MKPAVILAIFALLLGAGQVVADEPAIDRPVTPSVEAANQTSELEVPLSPMMQEIQAMLQTRNAARRTLEELAAEATDDQQALQIQRRIQAAAIQTELQVMRIQLKHLRLENRDEQAAVLEAQLEAMTAPQPPREPAERPAPADAEKRR